MIDLKQYLSLSDMLILATIDKQGNPHTSNVYFGYNPENYICYFISRPSRDHSENITANNNVAWSILDTNKYKPTDVDKKGLQFQGTCKVILGEEGRNIFEKYYRSRIAFPRLPDGHEVYECTPERVKIWDETLYKGEGKILEF